MLKDPDRKDRCMSPDDKADLEQERNNLQNKLNKLNIQIQ